MLDELVLRRLAEMGIDAYVPRATGAPPVSAAAMSFATAAPPARAGARARVLILTDAGSRWANGVITGVERMLKFARIAHATTDSVDESGLAAASGVVVFGEHLARKAGAMVPAQRQSEIAWVFAADAATVARDANAKRALGSELRRLLGTLNAAARAQ